MSEGRLIVGPFNRVEGDLEVQLEIADGAVRAAYANSPMFRGFERIMLGKGPLDALTITPRICGICSISQSAAAAQALADAAGLVPEPAGARVAALLHGVENLADHVTHFNLFFMPDFARADYAGRSWHARAVDRFTAMKGGAVHATTEARARLLHIVGLLGGKWPHTLAIQPGGVTKAPTRRDLIRIGTSLRAFRTHLERDLFGAPLVAFAGLSTVAAFEGWETGDAGLFVEIARDLGLDGLGRSGARYLSYGAYPGPEGRLFAPGIWAEGARAELRVEAIAEDLSHAWMLGDTAPPSRGETLPDPAMTAPGYSWCKAPRLDGASFETGAFARQVVDGHPLAIALAGEASVRSRIVGRLIEIARTQIALEQMLAGIDPEARFMVPVSLPDEAEGVGLVEAARGALGHWIRIERGKIAGYQIIAPTTWNFSPRDASGAPGPLEAALVGAPVAVGEETPVSVQHVVRSFDPCMVCTVH
ncbi:MAG: nickel-dependent hydrogenase large subunit [Maritimibacter sp.]|nr:nickel-dependent hydrogenase large subunit [Maritimibacter sp.]